MGLPKNNAIFSSVMTAIRSGEESMVVVGKIIGAGGYIIAAFFLGGLVMGIVVAVPCYFVFMHFFKYIRALKKSRKELID